MSVIWYNNIKRKGLVFMAVRRRKKARPNNMQDTWQNTAKEQPYLMPGTAEYEERIEDLKMHDPFRPDDEFHQELEERNEDLPQDIALRQPKKDNVMAERKLRERVKDSMYDSIAEKLQNEAAKTETMVDDERVAKLRQKDLEGYVSDNTVLPDDYTGTVMDKYL